MKVNFFSVYLRHVFKKFFSRPAVYSSNICLLSFTGLLPHGKCFSAISSTRGLSTNTWKVLRVSADCTCLLQLDERPEQGVLEPVSAGGMVRGKVDPPG